MKTYKSIIIGVMALVFTLPTMAQTVDKEAMYIYQNDGNASIFFRNEVTSISFETRDGEMNQVIQTADREYSYPVGNIQSMSFVFPEEDNNKPEGFPKENAPTFGTAIDLGLPSGTKWASINVGASKPEEYGGYYAWGEVNEKNEYNEVTYQYATGVVGVDGHSYIDYHSDTETWGIWQSLGSDIAGTQYDVAHVKWRGKWCMPNREQQDELWNYCVYMWITYRGVKGGLFIGPNGHSIFMSAAGSRLNCDPNGVGSHGFYWSSTNHDSYYSYGHTFNSNHAKNYGYAPFRAYGMNVRPVIKN